MKIAIFADVHANLVALQAVVESIHAWRPDHVVMAGDLVNRGPRPAECLRFFIEQQRAHGWLSVRGNHEDYVISHAHPGTPRHGPEFAVHQASYWTYTQLGEDVSALEAMPFQRSFSDPAGAEVRTVHASMLGNRHGIYPHTTDATLGELICVPGAAAPATLCVGHTHLPLVRSLDGTLVVNVGSAGLPFDGDPRPAYARLAWQHGAWHARIVRVDYDLAQAERDFYTTGYLTDAGPLIDLVLIELRLSRSLLYHWAIRYQQPALRGEISMRQSVDRFITEFL